MKTILKIKLNESVEAFIEIIIFCLLDESIERDRDNKDL